MSKTRFVILLTVLAAPAAGQTPLGTAFTYQGHLKDGGSPVNGPYDMHFRLYDASAGGTQLGPIICYNNLNVADGLFTATLDFGDQFGGQERFLEIAIRVDTGLNCANTSGFTTLSPRQKLTGTPNAIFSLNADKLDGLDATAFLQSIPMPLTLSGTSPTSHIIGGTNDAATANSYGVYGRSTATSGLTYGVYGRTDSAGGAGVNGYASSQTGDGIGVRGISSSADGYGVFGDVAVLEGQATGVWGRSSSTNGRGVFGSATATSGVTYGGRFESRSTGGIGVFSLASATSGNTFGLWGQSDSTSGIAVYANATSGTGTTYGVYGRNDSTSGCGVFGEAAAGTGTTYGGYFQTQSSAGVGVFGRATTTGRGVYGLTTSGQGVFGLATSGSALSTGVYGQSDSNSGRGVFGYASANVGVTYGGRFQVDSPDGRGVYGRAISISGDARGVYGVSDSTSGLGTVGYATASTGTTYGVYGQSDSSGGFGVFGDAAATSGTTYGVYGTSASSAGFAGYFVGAGGDALYVENNANGRGIHVVATADTGLWASTTSGVAGVDGRNASTTGRGVYGYATASTGTNYGVYGRTASGSGYGVYALGNSGASGTKSFRIDHPDDPTNKYLLHYSAESPEVINFYSGKVTLDGAGEAVVDLPSYFAKINKDPRYMLTAIGAPMPNLHVAEEIDEAALDAGAKAAPGEASPVCRFRIAGGAPGGRVSWEVKALRNDRWVQTHGAPVERGKEGLGRGTYQHPELYCQPPEKGVDYDASRDHLTPPRPAPVTLVKDGPN